MKYSEQPAFARPSVFDEQGERLEVGSYGLTMREYYAGLAMQGILSGNQAFTKEIVAKQAIALADELLKQLKEKKE